MDEGKEDLRMRFYAHTDITVGEDRDSWEKYAKWLEELSLTKINNEMFTRNKKLENDIEKAINILEKAVMG